MAEKIDLYDNQRNIVTITEYRAPLPHGLNKLFVHVWFVNSDGLFLMQQRVADTHRFPNKWCSTSGCVRHSETSQDALIRESGEELGIKIDTEKCALIATIKHPNDFVDIWLVKCDVPRDKLVLQAEEVQNAQWMSADEINAYYQADKCTPSVLPELQIIQNFFNFTDDNY